MEWTIGMGLWKTKVRRMPPSAATVELCTRLFGEETKEVCFKILR